MTTTVNERPKSMRIAVGLMITGAVVAGVQTLTTLAFSADIAALTRVEIERQGLQTSDAQIESAISMALGGAVIGGLLGVGLWLWMASANSKGRRWARTVATVFFVISIAGYLYSFASPALAASRIVASVSLAVGLAAIIAMYVEDSSEFYRAENYDGRGGRRS